MSKDKELAYQTPFVTLYNTFDLAPHLNGPLMVTKNDIQIFHPSERLPRYLYCIIKCNLETNCPQECIGFMHRMSLGHTSQGRLKIVPKSVPCMNKTLHRAAPYLFIIFCLAGLHTALTRLMQIFQTCLFTRRLRIQQDSMQLTIPIGIINYMLYRSFQYTYLEDFSFWPGWFRNNLACTFVLSLSLSPSLPLSLSFSLVPFLCLSQGQKNTNVPLILKALEIIFFCLGQNICPILCFASEKKIISQTFRIHNSCLIAEEEQNHFHREAWLRRSLIIGTNLKSLQL